MQCTLCCKPSYGTLLTSAQCGRNHIYCAKLMIPTVLLCLAGKVSVLEAGVSKPSCLFGGFSDVP